MTAAIVPARMSPSFLHRRHHWWHQREPPVKRSIPATPHRVFDLNGAFLWFEGPFLLFAPPFLRFVGSFLQFSPALLVFVVSFLVFLGHSLCLRPSFLLLSVHFLCLRPDFLCLRVYFFGSRGDFLLCQRACPKAPMQIRSLRRRMFFQVAG